MCLHYPTNLQKLNILRLLQESPPLLVEGWLSSFIALSIAYHEEQGQAFPEGLPMPFQQHAPKELQGSLHIQRSSKVSTYYLNCTPSLGSTAGTAVILPRSALPAASNAS